MLISFYFGDNTAQHETILRSVWWSLYFSLFIMFWHLPARLCGGVGAFVCPNRCEKSQNNVCGFFFLSALPSLMPSSLFIHFPALLNTFLLSAAAKINGEFCQVGHKWTCTHRTLKLLELKSSRRHLKKPLNHQMKYLNFIFQLPPPWMAFVWAN